MTDAHANIEQLLEIREGLQNDASSHVHHCRQCQQELDALCSIQQQIYAEAEQAPKAEVWDRIMTSVAKPQIQPLHIEAESTASGADNDRAMPQVPLELLPQGSPKAANDNSLSRSIYSLAASILVAGFIGLYIFGQQSTGLRQAELLSANIQELMLSSRGMERALQQVALQNELLTSDEQTVAERLYWRLTYVDQLIDNNNANESPNAEQIEQLWQSRIDALRELNQLYYQRQQTLDDSVI